MKVVIVDDEPIARRSLRESCARAGDVTVVGEFGDGAAAWNGICELTPELVFLDIQMDGMTGLQLARALPRERPPMIVFVTAYDRYAVEAFELNAIDYLLKPFDDARFDSTLERARRTQQVRSAQQRGATLEALIVQLEQRASAMAAQPVRLLGEANGRMHMLAAADIELVEADRNYVTLIAGRDHYHARSTLTQAEATLHREPMLRISRSCIVNSRHIAEISRTPRGDFILVMRGGTTVTSSEGYRDKVRTHLEEFRLKSGNDG